MVDLLSVAITVWLFLSLVFAVCGLLIWVGSDDKQTGSRIFFVAPVWPVAFLVWLLVNFRRLLTDTGWGQR